jgi:hypothetical protein
MEATAEFAANTSSLNVKRENTADVEETDTSVAAVRSSSTALVGANPRGVDAGTSDVLVVNVCDDGASLDEACSSLANSVLFD